MIRAKHTGIGGDEVGLFEEGKGKKEKGTHVI
jgi:hypothetical protein